MKRQLNVAHIKDLDPEEIRSQAWELEVAAVEIGEPEL
jgi:hypothetical protein